MRRSAFLLTLLMALTAVGLAVGQTPEDETIAKSLYLKASKAIRAEEYQEAVKLLTQILDEYPDSEVALDADEKLTAISDKAQVAGLPKVPGYYWVESDGTITEMPQRSLQTGPPYGYSDQWATFAQEQVPAIYADELSKFIVYRPKGDLKDVFWTSLLPLMSVNEKGEQVFSGNYGVFKEWSVASVDGKPFGASQVVFEEIKPGMWEVGFPAVFSPSNPIMCGLMDGSGKVGIVMVYSKMVHSFYPFLEFWEKPAIDLAQANYISKQRAKHPDNLDIPFFDAVLKYKTAYKENRPPVEAQQIARQDMARAKDSDITPKVLTDLAVLLEYCTADSVVRANRIVAGDSPETMAQKHAALRSFRSENVPADLYWIQEQIARNHAFVGEYDEAIIVAEKAVKTFKDKKPDTGTSLLGIVKVKVELDIGKPDKPEAFSIHDALTCYTLKPEWERIKDLKKEMEAEQLLGQATELMKSGGDAKLVEKALKSAKDKNNDSIRCYNAMIDFYNQSGNTKEVEKIQKDIDKAKKRITELEMSRASS